MAAAIRAAVALPLRRGSAEGGRCAGPETDRTSLNACACLARILALRNGRESGESREQHVHPRRACRAGDWLPPDAAFHCRGSHLMSLCGLVASAVLMLSQL